LWGARHPDQLAPVDEVTGWWLDAPAKTEIDRILRETIADPVGPEFMAPPARSSERDARTVEASAAIGSKRRRPVKKPLNERRYKSQSA